MQTRLILVLLALAPLVLAKKFKEEEKPAWAKKDIRDYSEADLERLLDQWEVCNNRDKTPYHSINFKSPYDTPYFR